MNEVEQLMLDRQIIDLYDSYLETSAPEGYETKGLREWIQSISEGERGNISLKDCVIGCIKTAIWSRKTSYDEILRIAANRQLEPDKKALQEEYEARLAKTVEATNSDFSTELSTHDLFEIRKLEIAITQMTRFELQDLFINTYRQTLIRERMYQTMLKRGWNAVS